VLAQDLDVVVQQQPFIIEVEPELRTDDIQVEFEDDNMINVSDPASDLELGKDRKFAIDGGGE